MINTNNNNRRFVNHIIRNVVQQNSIPDGTIPSPEAQFNLTKYFDDPNTVDLVFINMMERVRNEKSHYEPVLSRILKLVKNNISLHPPSIQILYELDSFCISTAPTANITLQKSITYIRALIGNQIKQHPHFLDPATYSHHTNTLSLSVSSTGSNSSSVSVGSNTSLGVNNTYHSSKSSSSHLPHQGHHQSHSQPSSSTLTSDRRSSIGIVRTRSQSASTYVSPREDSGPPSLLQQQQQQLQRSSLDLGNINLLSTSNTSGGAVSSSTSTSSSPQSFSDSPIRNTLLNQSASSAASTPLSPTLVATSATSISPLMQETLSSMNNSNNNNNNLGVNSTGGPISNSSSGSNLTNTIVNLRESSHNSNNGVLTSSSSSNLTISPTLSRRMACQEDGYINDLMGLKCCQHKSILKNNKIQSLLTHSPFGVLKGEEIKGKDVFTCPDDNSNMTPITIVQQTKKRMERKDATILTIRRRKAPALFQYKYYRDQEQLKISENEKQQVIKVIINPSTAQDRSIASKIFIKIILDIYCKHGVEGEKLIQSYFNNIIASSQRDARIHLFNIIFNLSIHINIYSELKLDDGAQGVIGDLQESVFSLLREVLLYCVKNEQDEKVWMEALSCMIFFVVDQGVVIRNRLHSLNSQIIASFLKYAHEASDQTKRLLVRMLCNFLYKDNPNNIMGSSISMSGSGIIGGTINNNSSSVSGQYMYLNEDELNSIGGIDFILRLYTTIRSNEAKNNLFVVIFDYVLQSALKSQTIADSQLTQDSPVLLELFKRADAPHYFVQLFKCIPERDFVSDFFLFTSSSDSKNHESSFSYEDLIIKFSMKIHEHAVRYQKLDQTYEKYVFEVQDYPEKASALLQEWLFNENDEQLRFNGAKWLHTLLKKIIIDKEPPNFALHLFHQLATHPNPVQRRIYISLTERLLLLSKYKLKTGESKSNEILEFFNECILRLVTYGEKEESNLLMISDILFDLIYSRNGTKSLYIKDSQTDTNYSLFLNNQFAISISLIKSINIIILQYIFSNITNLEKYNETRLVLLHLLILRCNECDELAKIGGIGFFKNLMNDPFTPIAYHSSYFLLTQLEAESPEQYRSILQRLLSKARENNDENLISNPFFQVQGIIDMTHKT